MELSNLDGVPRPVNYELDWHTDQTYTPQPVFGTILYKGIVAQSEKGRDLGRTQHCSATLQLMGLS